MKLTIIPSDSAIYKDGVVRELDLSTCGIPENVHALQWYDTFGEIEFSSNPGQPKPANEPDVAGENGPCRRRTSRVRQ